MRSNHPDLRHALDERLSMRHGLRDLVREGGGGINASDEPALVAALHAALFHRVPLRDLVVSGRSPGRVRGLHAHAGSDEEEVDALLGRLRTLTRPTPAFSFHPVDLDWPCELGSPGEARGP